YAARAGLNPLLISGPKPGGQLMDTTDVENFPGYKNGILGPEMMEDLKEQCLRFGTRISEEVVTKVNVRQSTEISDRNFEVITESNSYITESVIISTGAQAKWLGLENEKKYYGKGLSACATCDGFFFRGQDVIVVGGGDTACEEAIYLSNICSRVIMLLRSDNMVASKIMQERVKSTNNIEIRFNTHIIDFKGEDLLDGVYTNQGDINVSGVFIAIGHKPNTQPFKDVIGLDEEGYIITKPGSTKTSQEGIFACGDVQDKIYRQAITAAGTGCMAALDCERYLSDVSNLRKDYEYIKSLDIKQIVGHYNDDNNDYWRNNRQSIIISEILSRGYQYGFPRPFMNLKDYFMISVKKGDEII
ncbi:hypothetical protein EBU94_04665, partial [bacterium]|nr:hypothetical protein [bacterium]